MKNKLIIGVIGAGTCDGEISSLARDVGAGIAREGAILVCGGRGGVMEAACRGARSQGGLTVGILPDDTDVAANAFVDIPIPTGMGIARNAILVRTAHALVAVSGGPGTLSEIAFALQLGVPVVSLKSWDVSAEVEQVESPEAAVSRALELAALSR